MFALSKLSGQLEVPSGTRSVPLEEEAWSMCRNLWSKGVSQSSLWRALFSRRFPLLVDYCGAFQNPLYSLESFVPSSVYLLPGPWAAGAPTSLSKSGMGGTGSLLWVYGRRRLSVCVVQLLSEDAY